MNQEKLKRIIRELSEIRNDCGLCFTDDKLVDVAVRIYNTENMNFIPEPEQKEIRKDEPATDKQKETLEKLGIKYNKEITKHQAYILLSEKLGKK